MKNLNNEASANDVAKIADSISKLQSGLDPELAAVVSGLLTKRLEAEDQKNFEQGINVLSTSIGTFRQHLKPMDAGAVCHVLIQRILRKSSSDYFATQRAALGQVSAAMSPSTIRQMAIAITPENGTEFAAGHERVAFILGALGDQLDPEDVSRFFNRIETAINAEISIDRRMLVRSWLALEPVACRGRRLSIRIQQALVLLQRTDCVPVVTDILSHLENLEGIKPAVFADDHWKFIVWVEKRALATKEKAKLNYRP